jgi:hypothetical protein
MLLLVGGAFPARACLASHEPATAFAETVKTDGCCVERPLPPGDHPSELPGEESGEQPPEQPGEEPSEQPGGCDCPLACCPVIATAAIPVSVRAVADDRAQTAWETASERRVLARSRGGPERPPKL